VRARSRRKEGGGDDTAAAWNSAYTRHPAQLRARVAEDTSPRRGRRIRGRVIDPDTNRGRTTSERGGLVLWKNLRAHVQPTRALALRVSRGIRRSIDTEEVDVSIREKRGETYFYRYKWPRFPR